MKDSQMSSQALFDLLVREFDGFKTWLDTEIDLIKPYLQADHQVLDIGCGWGREIMELAPHVRQFAGLDIELNELKATAGQIQAMHQVTLIAGDGLHIPFASDTFDTVLILGNTFGNFDTLKSHLLIEMQRVLRHDGRLFISVYRDSRMSDRVRAYHQTGIKITSFKDNRVEFADGFISEGFNPQQLRSLLTAHQFNVTVYPCGKVGWLAVASLV